MEYKVLIDKNDIYNVIPEILANKLYQYKTWRMYSYFTSDRSRINKLAYCKINNKIVGVSVCIEPPDEDVNVSVYVNEDYRRMGIGTKLIQLLEMKVIYSYEVGYRKKFWQYIKGN